MQVKTVFNVAIITTSYVSKQTTLVNASFLANALNLSIGCAKIHFRTCLESLAILYWEHRMFRDDPQEIYQFSTLQPAISSIPPMLQSS